MSNGSHIYARRVRCPPVLSFHGAVLLGGGFRLRYSAVSETP